MAYPGPPNGPSHPPTSSPNGERDANNAAQLAIQEEARRITRAWPVASQLQGTLDVVHHLPPLQPTFPSFFPTFASPDLPSINGSVPQEQLFDHYARELATLAGNRGGPAEDYYRHQEARRVLGTREVQGELNGVRQNAEASGSYGGISLPEPPFPFTASKPLPPLQPDSTFSSQFLSAAGLPAYSVPPSSSVPAASGTASNGHQPLASVTAFVDAQVVLAQAAAAASAQSAAMQRSASSGSRGASWQGLPQTPSSSQHNGPSRIFSLPIPSRPPSHPHVIPTSSPDPLSLTPYVAAPQPRPRIAAVTGGMRYTADHSPQSVNGGALSKKRSSASLASASPTRPHSHNFELVVPSPARRRSSDKGKGRAEGDAADAFTPRPTASAPQLGAPFTLSGAGVDTGMKRFKLDFVAPKTPGTGASGSAKPGVVERLDDLLSDIFSADDALVADTSAAAMGGINRSPSRRAGASTQEERFFRTTAVASSSSLPLLHSSTLSKVLKLLGSVTAKNKAEEFVEAVEDTGVARLLKLLERSWDGLDGGDWEGWEKEAGEAREDVAAALAEAQGKKGKGGKKASPAKGKKGGVKGKGKKQVVEEECEEEGPDELSTTSAPIRRSSRTPSPSLSRSVPLPPTSPSASQPEESFWTFKRLASTSSALRNLHDALLALRLALEVLTLPLSPAHPLPKHLFSVDYLSSLISTLRKAALDACFLPLLESPPSSPLADLLAGRAGGAELRERLSGIAEDLHQAVEALAKLVKKEELGEELVISLAYLSLEPFFHDIPLSTTATGKARAALGGEGPIAAAHKGLRMASLELVKAVYGRYAKQRAWIVEEVLGNLGKGDAAAGGKKSRGGIRLRTSATIQTTSALLLHLVQTPPFELAASVRRRLAQADREHKDAVDESGDALMSELGIGAGISEKMRLKEEEGEDEVEEKNADVMSSVSRRLLEPAAEASQRSARSIVGLLLQRAAKAGKTASGTADSEYRAVLDHLVTDLLAVLHLPEWPGADVLLGVLCRSMMATLSDAKSTHESNALKGLALEYLGSIAAKIQEDSASAAGEMSGLGEIVTTANVDTLEKVFAAHKSLVEHLDRKDRDDGLGEGAADFVRLEIARDLLQAHAGANLVLAQLSAEDARSEAGQAAVYLAERLDLLARAIWEEPEGEDVFGPSPEDAQPRIDAVALDLWRCSSVAAMYPALLDRIVDASESAQVTLRTKALRAVSLVVAQDPDLFYQDNVRRSIENRMLDASPAVRDASIELVGKYVVSRPALARQYLPKLLDRLSDTGLSVRRRVVKLLKVLYYVVDSEEQKTEISKRLVFRVLDEDDNIKDLAVEAIEDLWFGPPPKASSGVSQDSLDEIARLAQVILETTGVYRERAPPVDEALKLIMLKHAEKGSAPPLDRVKSVVETLIDGLVENDREMDLVAGVKTVHVLNTVDPSLLSTAKATLLLPFLKSASNVEEQTISDFLLKIFHGAVLAQPKTSSKFGKDLQGSLVPMLNKPSSNTMQEIIGCFCAVIHSQTQDYATMVRIFSISLARLANEAQKLLDPVTSKTVNLRQLPVLCFMSALFCEHGNFDRVREEQPAVKQQLDRITSTSIAEHTYSILVRLHGLALPPAVKSAILTSLGFLYRAHPTLMLHSASTAIIDAIFTDPNPAMHVQVLKIVQDFLASQERAGVAAATAPTKQKKAEQGVRMEELVGNVEGFADSGVASAIAQRYLPRIIDSALSTNLSLQRLGADLLSTIAHSGFSHPITLSATLVALTASPDPQTTAKAYSTLSFIHQKHASLLATRFLEPARTTHSYVVSTSGGKPVRGFRGEPPESLLGKWFSLLHREKRQVQLDYLKALARSFEVEAGVACSEDDVSFARFITESISTFDFKRAEEPMLVVSVLNSVLAVSGLQVLHHLEQDLAGGGGLLAAASGQDPAESAVSPPSESPPSADLARQSIVCGLALLLRDHLKHVYSVTDAKLARYVVGKKSAAGDRAVTHRNDAPFALGTDSYARMPFALIPMKTADDLVSQRETYRRLVAEDGTIGALDELAEDEDEHE
ncbi:hypothetical protein JCM11641_005602 [Rhodosporidiobolus odoratus]